jgi:hypothetical protein
VRNLIIGLSLVSLLDLEFQKSYHSVQGGGVFKESAKE